MLRAQPPLALIPASVVPPLVAAGELEELAFDRAALAVDPIGAQYRQEEERPGLTSLLQALRTVDQIA